MGYPTEFKPVSQPSTVSYVAMPGAILDLASTDQGNAVIVVQETGGVNGVTFKVQATLNDPYPVGANPAWFDVAVNSYNQDGVVGFIDPQVDQPVEAGAALVINSPYNNGTVGPWPGRWLQVLIEDTAGQAVNHVWTLAVGTNNGGTFTVTYKGQTTAAQAWNVSAANLQTAIQGLSTVGASNATVSLSGTTYTITFVNALAAQPLTITANLTTLTGGSGAALTNTTPGNTGHGVGRAQGFAK